MATAYENQAREKIRVEFAKQRRKGLSVAESSKLAGISPSTYYSWNKGEGWSKGDGWSKESSTLNFDDKADGFSK